MITAMIMTRHLPAGNAAAMLPLLAALLAGWIADACNNPVAAMVFNISNRAPAEISISVGSSGTISRVSFNVADDDVGSGNPVRSNRRINIRLRIRAPAANPLTGFLTVDSSTPLQNGSGATIPMTEISWTAISGDIPSGSFRGINNQQLASFTSSIRVFEQHTFSYNNRSIYDAGTYNGQVTYTWFAP
jgi:hypothetical protein